MFMETSPLMMQNSLTPPGNRLLFTWHILIVLYLRGIAFKKISSQALLKPNIYHAYLLY